MFRALGGVEGKGDDRILPFHAVDGFLSADGGGLRRRRNEETAGDDGGAEQQGAAAEKGNSGKGKAFHNSPDLSFFLILCGVSPKNELCREMGNPGCAEGRFCDIIVKKFGKKGRR